MKEEIQEDQKKVVEVVNEVKEIKINKPKTFDTSGWEPKTEIGKKVKSGEIKDLQFILDKGLTIFEPEIVELLLPDLETDLLLIGQAKGKFGGGQRRVFRQTQKKTREGNKPKFSTLAVVGNKNGFVGVGFGKAKETVPAREKAIRNAKLNIFKVKRGCGSWECACGGPHSIPFVSEGKCGSVKIKIMPAPKGKGLIAESELQKIFKLAGINDIWSRSLGQTKTKLNMVYAGIDALKNLTVTKIDPNKSNEVKIVDGAIVKKE